MIPYCSFLALMFGNSSLSALQSHLPLHYLGSGALSYLKGAVWSRDLDLVIPCKEMVCPFHSGCWATDLTTSSLTSGRSLGDLGFCDPVRCLVRFHIIMCPPCHLQVKRCTTLRNSSSINTKTNKGRWAGINSLLYVIMLNWVSFTIWKNNNSSMVFIFGTNKL